MSIRIDVDKEIAEKIGQATIDVINVGIARAAPAITNRLGELLVNLVKQGRTYRSLVNGDLRYEFGLANPQSQIDPILDIVRESVEFKFELFKYSRGKVNGGFSIVFLPNGLSKIINSPTASYKSNSYDIDWLDWLLTKGDAIIVFDHHIVFDLNTSQSVYSRTGDALMFRGGTWRVPAEFSGTETDNFLTIEAESRAFQKAANEIINQELKKVF